MTALILIPARMASTRLPGKPLADIAGLPMIVHVAARASESGLGRVVVATDHGRRVRCRAGARLRGGDDAGRPPVRLRPHFRGACSARSRAARSRSSSMSRATCRPSSRRPSAPRSRRSRTPRSISPRSAVEIDARGGEDQSERRQDRRLAAFGDSRLRALYFTRATAPHGNGPLYHHIGLYAYRRAALERFVSLRRRRWKSAKSSSSCARSKPACASTSRSSDRCRSASIRRKISNAPATCFRQRRLRTSP